MRISYDNMQSLNGKLNLALPTPKKGTPRSHREEMVETIRRSVNETRIGTKYKPLTYMAVYMKVRPLTDFYLGALLQECQKSSNFSQTFFGKLKKKKKVD